MFKTKKNDILSPQVKAKHIQFFVTERTHQKLFLLAEHFETGIGDMCRQIISHYLSGVVDNAITRHRENMVNVSSQILKNG